MKQAQVADGLAGAGGGVSADGLHNFIAVKNTNESINFRRRLQQFGFVPLHQASRDHHPHRSGKIKMLAQSIAVGAVLGSLATSFRRGGFHPVMWIVITRDIFIWLTLGATVASALEYVHRARRIMEA